MTKVFDDLLIDRLDRIESKVDKYGEATIRTATSLDNHLSDDNTHFTKSEMMEKINGKLKGNGGLSGKATIALIGVISGLVTIVANFTIK